MTGVEDAAARVLRVAVRALPRSVADWGRAMTAELASLDGAAERRRFALSCLWAVLTCRPAVLLALPRLALVGYALLGVAFALQLPAGTQRYGAIVVVLVLTVGCGVACGRFGFGRAGHGWLGRLVRAGGLAVVGAEVLDFVWSLQERGDGKLMAVATAMLAVLLLAVVRLTAERSAISRPVLAAGVGVGLGAAALWTAGAVVLPKLPSTFLPVLVIVGAAGIWASLLARLGPGGRSAGPVAALAAPALAAHVIALVIATVLPLWSRWVPNDAPPVWPRWVPGAPPPISPYRLDDPIGAFLLSVLLSFLVVVAVQVRSRRRDSSTPDPVSLTVAQVVD